MGISSYVGPTYMSPCQPDGKVDMVLLCYYLMLSPERLPSSAIIPNPGSFVYKLQNKTNGTGISGMVFSVHFPLETP